jgi:hypothetical protein
MLLNYSLTKIDRVPIFRCVDLNLPNRLNSATPSEHKGTLSHYIVLQNGGSLFYTPEVGVEGSAQDLQTREFILAL